MSIEIAYEFLLILLGAKLARARRGRKLQDSRLGKGLGLTAVSRQRGRKMSRRQRRVEPSDAHPIAAPGACGRSVQTGSSRALARSFSRSTFRDRGEIVLSWLFDDAI